MKGQFNIEYLVSLTVFVVVLIFVSTQVARVTPELHSDSVSNRLDAKSFRLTDTLIKTQGEPDNWHTSSPDAIGLTNGEPYILSEDKISAFNSVCSSDYNSVRDIFSIMPGSDFQITIVVDNTIAMDCGQRAPSNVVRVVARRYAVTEAGEDVDLIFSMW